MGQKEWRSDRKGNKIFSPITGMYAQGSSVGEMLYNTGKAIPKFMDDFDSIQWTELDEGHAQEVLKSGIKFADGTI